MLVAQRALAQERKRVSRARPRWRHWKARKPIYTAATEGYAAARTIATGAGNTGVHQEAMRQARSRASCSVMGLRRACGHRWKPIWADRGSLRRVRETIDYREGALHLMSAAPYIAVAGESAEVAGRLEQVELEEAYGAGRRIWRRRRESSLRGSARRAGGRAGSRADHQYHRAGRRGGRARSGAVRRASQRAGAARADPVDFFEYSGDADNTNMIPSDHQFREVQRPEGQAPRPSAGDRGIQPGLQLADHECRGTAALDSGNLRGRLGR